MPINRIIGSDINGLVFGQFKQTAIPILIYHHHIILVIYSIELFNRLHLVDTLSIIDLVVCTLHEQILENASFGEKAEE